MQRRGDPLEIFSDNGTNFVKSERILREQYCDLDMNEILRKFVSPELKWNFNPLRGHTWVGGAWERLVKSVKSAFYAMKPMRTMNDQLLRSCTMEAENMVNSRQENEEALTPNHFIRGNSGGGRPIAVFDDDPVLLISNWQMCINLQNH